MSQNNPLFLIHIGTGKTGSTSIQRFFKDFREQHKKLGLHYLGLHLSFTDQNILYSWQSEDETEVFKFQLLDDDIAYQQLENVLCNLLENRNLPNYFIWSFESIYDRPQVYAKLFLKLSKKYAVNSNL